MPAMSMLGGVGVTLLAAPVTGSSSMNFSYVVANKVDPSRLKVRETKGLLIAGSTITSGLRSVPVARSMLMTPATWGWAGS